ncbi:MAG: hypothetical protein IJT60_06835 [Clostridia bacterium]|nr:hypothetical protein [Clostridia bacterium]
MEEKQKSTLKKVGGIVLNVVLWAFVVFAVVITIIVISASTSSKNVPTLGGNCFLNVQTNSMNAAKPDWVPEDKPSGFSAGTLIIGKYIADDNDLIDALEVGDIVTFEAIIEGVDTYNTHRITEISRDSAGYITSVTTRGDHPDASTEVVTRGKLIAVYQGSKILGLGAFLNFLNTQLGFGLCILLPMAAFFIYELVRFILLFVRMRNQGKKVITSTDEELIKQKAIEEYLRQQAEAAAQAEAKPEETAPEAQPEETPAASEGAAEEEPQAEEKEPEQTEPSEPTDNNIA